MLLSGFPKNKYQSQTEKRFSGFTIVELLVAMMIGSILAISVVALFINQTRAMALNEDLVDLEQNLRVAMDMLHRDVRMAGAYTRDVIPPFVVGGIDSDGNGSLDKNSDGGASPDAIQIRYSEGPGLGIVIFAGTEFRVCTPSGIAAEQTMVISNGDATSSIELPVKNIGHTACPVQCGPPGCDRINYDPPPLSGYLGGVVWDELKTLTYFIEPDYIKDGSSLGPVLMQKRGLKLLPPPEIVAFGITDLQIVYRDLNGSETTTLADIQRVGIALSGETRNLHNIVGVNEKKKRTMETEVLVRNLTF